MSGEAGHWFEGVARHLGPAYLRYSFTMGTGQEVDTLMELLPIAPGDRVLDVGCGPGRHALELGKRGVEVVGVDISHDFVVVAQANAHREGITNVSFEVQNARRLAFDADFDVVISLCQGAFGLSGGPGAPDVLPHRELDEAILEGVARSLRPGGKAAVSAFSAYFMLRFLEEHDTFDAVTGVNHETTTLKNVEGDEVDASLWTTCFTPRELRLLARAVGLEPTGVYGVTPGKYGSEAPSVDVPEFLLVASKPLTQRA